MYWRHTKVRYNEFNVTGKKESARNNVSLKENSDAAARHLRQWRHQYVPIKGIK